MSADVPDLVKVETQEDTLDQPVTPARPTAAEEAAPPAQNRVPAGEAVSRDVIRDVTSASLATLRRIKTLLETNHLGRDNGHKKITWIERGDATAAKAQEPVQSVIAVTGSTGSGKSAMINALLERSNLVPSSCARACTAVVTEISYHDQPGIRAQVDFLTPEEWRTELEDLQNDLVSAQTKENHWDDPSSENEQTDDDENEQMDDDYFPDVLVETLLETPFVKQHLGQSVTVEAVDSDEFAEKIRKYVDSRGEDDDADDEEPQQYWPLIKQVRICVKADVLSSGAVLVDLPGAGDSNAARSAMAAKYLRTSSGVYVVADQTRAVDDKTAQTLLSESLAQQLSLDGKLSAITFVVTKSDVIKPAEILKAGILKKLADCADLPIQIKDLKKKLKKQIQDEKNAEKARNGVIAFYNQSIAAEATAASTMQSSGKRKNPEDSTASNKRARSSADTVEQRNSAEHPEVQPENTQEELDQRCRRAEKRYSDAKTEKERLQDELKGLETLLNQKCSLARNKYSKGALAKSFERRFAIIRQKSRQDANPLAYDPDARQEQPDNELPKIPIYCVSSAEFLKMSNIGSEDEVSTAFLNISDTEIPQLQAHTLNATAHLEYARAETCLAELRDLCLQISTQLSHTECPADEAEAIRSAYLKEQELCRESMALFLTEVTAKSEKTIQSGVQAKLEHGAATAQAAASEVSKAIAEPLHWSQWRACVKRNGLYPKTPVDLNGTLCRPMIEAIDSSWSALFSNPSIAEGYPDLVLASVQRLRSAIDSASQDSIEGGRSQSASISANNASLLQSREILKQVSESVDSTKEDAWRQLATSVQKALEQSYQTAAAIRGAGMNARSQQCIHDSLSPPDGSKPDTFANASKEVVTSLDKIPPAVVAILDEGFGQILKALEAVFEPLWDPTETDKDKESVARRNKLIADIEAEGRLASRLQETLLNGERNESGVHSEEAATPVGQVDAIQGHERQDAGEGEVMYAL